MGALNNHQLFLLSCTQAARQGAERDEQAALGKPDVTEAVEHATVIRQCETLEREQVARLCSEEKR